MPFLPLALCLLAFRVAHALGSPLVSLQSVLSPRHTAAVTLSSPLPARLGSFPAGVTHPAAPSRDLSALASPALPHMSWHPGSPFCLSIWNMRKLAPCVTLGPCTTPLCTAVTTKASWALSRTAWPTHCGRQGASTW